MFERYVQYDSLRKWVQPYFDAVLDRYEVVGIRSTLIPSRKNINGITYKLRSFEIKPHTIIFHVTAESVYAERDIIKLYITEQEISNLKQYKETTDQLYNTKIEQYQNRTQKTLNPID